MKYGKRQLIIASLILALGAAVYLNWQFAGPAVEAGAEVSETDTSSTLGAAQLVNNNYIEPVTDTVDDAEAGTQSTATEPEASGAETAAKPDAALSEARITRQSARDEAVAMLEDVLADESAEGSVREAAVSEASAIAQNILKETSIETQLSAKGFTDSVAYISGESCSVVVAGDVEDAQNALIIRDVVVTETGLSAEKIKIIPAA